MEEPGEPQPHVAPTTAERAGDWRSARLTASARAGVTVLALVLAVEAVAAWKLVDRSGPELRALQRDPMASYAPVGIAAFRNDQDDAGSSMGKRHRAGIWRAFRVPEDRAVAEFKRARAAAVRAGWTPDDESKPAEFDIPFGGSVGWSGRRPEPADWTRPRAASVSIRLAKDPRYGPGADPVLSITLDGN
ncbi:MAG: hypothetical protein J7513_06950 [Solirubrobacteraceae bacterium]|nr:hypothetical protein [Solirubrobacteraceae bacterium]